MSIFTDILKSLNLVYGYFQNVLKNHIFDFNLLSIQQNRSGNYNVASAMKYHPIVSAFRKLFSSWCPWFNKCLSFTSFDFCLNILCNILFAKHWMIPLAETPTEKRFKFIYDRSLQFHHVCYKVSKTGFRTFASCQTKRQ